MSKAQSTRHGGNKHTRKSQQPVSSASILTRGTNNQYSRPGLKKKISFSWPRSTRPRAPAVAVTAHERVVSWRARSRGSSIWGRNSRSHIGWLGRGF